MDDTLKGKRSDVHHDAWQAPPAADLESLAATYTEPVPAVSWKPGERRQVALLFLELQDLLSWHRVLKTDEVGRVLEKVYRVFEGIVASFGGYIELKEGAEMVALFGIRKASGMELQQALRAALEMLDRLHQINRYLSNREIHLDLKIGVHSARISVDQDGALVRHDAIKSVERLSRAAAVGTVLVERHTREAVGDVFVYEALGLIHLQGVSELIRAYRVVGLNPRREGRWQRSMMVRRSQFVGREPLLAQLQACYQGCANQSEEKWRRDEMGGKKYLPPTFVGLSGDIGTGKSRLLYEFGQRLNALTESISRRVQGRADPLAHVPYGVFVSLLKVLSGIQPSDSAVVRRRKLESSLRPLHAYQSSLECHGPILGHLVGVKYDAPAVQGCEPALWQQQVHDALTHLISALAIHHYETWSEPLVVYWKDLHWADERSLEAMESLIRSLRLPVPLFIAATYHTEYQPPVGLKRFCELSQFTLGPLSTEEVSLLVDSMLPGFDLPQALSSKLQELAAGNPYYVEELVRNLVENRVVVKDSNGWHLNDPEGEVLLPESLAGLVLSRMDKLPREVRDTLACASVVGVIFQESLLRHILSRLERRNLEAHLKVLLEERLLRPVRAVRQASYSFPNQVSREAIYNTLLPENRRLLHTLAAEGILELFAPHVEAHFGSLGFHFMEAGEDAKAARHLALAAQRAYQQNSFDLALGYIRMYLSLGIEGDETQHLCLRRAHCLMKLDRFEEAQTQLEGLLERLNQSENPSPALQKLGGQVQIALAETCEALGLGDKAVFHRRRVIEEANRLEDVAAALEGRHQLLKSLYRQGLFQQALGIWQDLNARPSAPEHWRGTMASIGGQLKLQMADPKAAVRLFEVALREHIRRGEADCYFRDTCHLVEALIACGDCGEARLRLSEVLSKIDDPHNSDKLNQVILLQRAALALEGGEAALLELNRAVEACARTGDSESQAMGHRLLALLMARRGEMEQAGWHEASAERAWVDAGLPDAESA